MDAFLKEVVRKRELEYLRKVISSRFEDLIASRGESILARCDCGKRLYGDKKTLGICYRCTLKDTTP